MYKSILFLFFFSLLVLPGFSQDKIVPGMQAPEVNSKYGWINTTKPITLNELKGKMVLLDFWTFGCINCQHIIPDLKKLEKEYEKELVVIGVHSAKFDSEKNTDNIRKAVLKYGIEHPVVNDADYDVWNKYGVESWPTVVLIDPDGKIVKKESGEGVYEVFKPEMEQTRLKFEGKINERIISFGKETMNAGILKFPAKLCLDESGNIYVSDAGHNRILKIAADGKLLETIGDGLQGLKDGTFQETRFNDPQGLCYKDNLLYVADTRNHAIRKIDFTKKTVETIFGNGTQEINWKKRDARPGEALNSPWDVQINGNELYIAMAGNHQIWKADLTSGTARVLAGDAEEALKDGTYLMSSFSQPSGLFLNKNMLYVADAEASAIRVLDMQRKVVSTLLGSGLFDFGDVDGPAQKAQIQHSTGLCVKDNILFIADTYNGKIKQFDLQTRNLVTLAAGLEEPNAVACFNDSLYITNTNKNQLVRINLKTKEKEVMEIRF